MELINRSDNLIKNRYSIIGQLGEGGSGITYAAKDLTNDERVAIKVLSLDRLDEWKKIELFEREAKILQQLNHPGIPKYLDYFPVEIDNKHSFCIIQQLAPGQSLSGLINDGWQLDTNTIKNIAEQILNILVYLQQLTPPVIHRDIKPQNIIYQPDTGKLFLVDFGAVQDTYHHTVIGSTIVGTYGYIAPEQYRGRAVLATDLYSLGCTLLFLLTGQSPVELPHKNLKIRFRSIVTIEPNFARWLDKLIAPDIGDRFPKAKDALQAFHNKNLIDNYRNLKPRKPEYSLVELTYYQRKLIIKLPPACLYTKKTSAYYLFLLGSAFTTANVIALAISWGVLYLGVVWIVLSICGLLCDRYLGAFIYFLQFLIFIILTINAFYYLPLNISFFVSFIVVLLQFISNSFLRYQLLREIFCPTRFECDLEKTQVKRRGFYWSSDYSSKQHVLHINKYTFGHFLTKSEKLWLATEINKYVDSHLAFEDISKIQNENYFQNIISFFTIATVFFSTCIKKYPQFVCCAILIVCFISFLF